MNWSMPPCNCFWMFEAFYNSFLNRLIVIFSLEFEWVNVNELDFKYVMWMHSKCTIDLWVLEVINPSAKGRWQSCCITINTYHTFKIVWHLLFLNSYQRCTQKKWFCTLKKSWRFESRVFCKMYSKWQWVSINPIFELIVVLFFESFCTSCFLFEPQAFALWPI